MSTKSSLFDDIFRLQNAAPEDDIDPEDVDETSRARVTEGSEAAESLGASSLRTRNAIIEDDPKYIGKRTSRKDLYDDDGNADHSSGSEQDNFGSDDNEDDEDESGPEEDDMEEDDEEEEEDSDDDVKKDLALEGGDESIENDTPEAQILPTSKSDDRGKGKAVSFQLGVWDDLIKSRIALQKLLMSCNRLPQPDTWSLFFENDDFRKEAKNVHSSVRKLVSVILELQAKLMEGNSGAKPQKNGSAESDEEITSESDDNDDEEEKKKESPKADTNGVDKEDESDAEEEENMEEEVEEVVEGDDDEDTTRSLSSDNTNRPRLKRKLNVEEMEESLAKRHKDFQKFRNDTLSKWDEKTRLVHAKIRSKNFAAFEMSVLKQIEQVLANRERLVRRLHQQRVPYRVLGRPEDRSKDETAGGDQVVEDDDEDVELKLKQHNKSEKEIDEEIIDDNDFYHVCLRDLIELKQNEETDPVIANRQWLEIQRLRNKQKRKVDTRASKGRKIRYSVKEKLKNYMTPYDKSLWSDEQKDDLFKALFGGKSSGQVIGGMGMDEGSIRLGI